MKTTLPIFQQAAVLVIGDVMLDRYWHGLTNRISPEAPVPVVRVEQIEDRPGGAANVAMNTAALGVKTCLIGLTGQDEAAQLLAKQLQQANVDCDFVQLASHPTITKLRVLAKHQQLIRLDFEQGFDNVNQSLIYPKISQQLPQVGAVILSDYAKGALAHVQGMIQLAKQAKLPVLVDPKGKDFSRYRGATLLTPNLAEFEAVVGSCRDEQQLIDKGLALIAEHDFAALLITRSEQGMTLLQPGQSPLHFATQAQEVYDVTGAGDTVIGMIGSALAAGKNLQQACYLANVAAGIVVGKLGTSTVLPIEVENVIHGRSEAGFGLLNEAQLKQAVALAKQGGETVVMTNGCFDILHAGHVAYLQQARSLGDRLIVAVNTDASTARLKGSDRPINPLAERMQVLSGLAAVDWVVAFDEDTPQRLISEILPDILVKGGDYQVDEIAGGKEVIANGGQVQVLTFKEGCSTSKIIQTIQTQQR